MRATLILMMLAALAVAGGAFAQPRYETAYRQTVRTTQHVRGCLMSTLAGRVQPIETELRRGQLWRIAFLDRRNRLTLTVEATPQGGARIAYPRRLGASERVEPLVLACT